MKIIITKHNDDEIWTGIDGYENYYISNKGKIKSKKRQGTKGEYLKQFYLDGYKRVHLRKDYKYKSYLVHRLVANAFISNPLNLPQINHKNGIRDDNRVQNIEWVSASDNILHCYRTGLHRGQKGKLNGNYGHKRNR